MTLLQRDNINIHVEIRHKARAHSVQPSDRSLVQKTKTKDVSLQRTTDRSLIEIKDRSLIKWQATEALTMTRAFETKLVTNGLEKQWIAIHHKTEMQQWSEACKELGHATTGTTINSTPAQICMIHGDEHTSSDEITSTYVEWVATATGKAISEQLETSIANHQPRLYGVNVYREPMEEETHTNDCKLLTLQNLTNSQLKQ